MEEASYEIFFCDSCDVEFYLKKDFYDHMKVHARDDPYVCDICERQYADKSLLVGHLSIHSNKRVSVCEVCKRGFVDKTTINAHARSHAEREPYICDVYEMELSEKPAEEKDFEVDCTLKGTKRNKSHTFNVDESNMIRHMRFHSLEKTFLCEICTLNNASRDYSYTRNVADRGDKKSSSIPRTRFCTEESASFDASSKEDSTRRISNKRRFLSSTLKTLVCDTCKKSFSGKYDLLVHFRTHLKVKAFVCPTCKEGFSNKRNLKKHHLEFHPNEIPYVCEICRKSFSNRRRLLTHLHTHTEGRAVICETCKKGTYQKCHRDVHIRMHTRQKPFVCDVYENLSVKNSMIRHLCLHPEENASICELCNKNFSDVLSNLSLNFSYS